MLGFYATGQAYAGQSGLVAETAIVVVSSTKLEIKQATLDLTPHYVVSAGDTTHKIYDDVRLIPHYVLNARSTKHEIHSDTVDLYQLLQFLTASDTRLKTHSSTVSLAGFVILTASDNRLRTYSDRVPAKMDSRIYNGIQWVNKPR